MFRGTVTRLRFFLLPMLTFLALTACTASQGELLVYTDRPDLALLAGEYMSKNPGIAIDLRFKEDLSEFYRGGGVEADLLVGKNLLSAPLLEHFMPLDRSVADGRLNFENFLGIAARAGQNNGAMRAVALGFDLPALISLDGGARRWRDSYEGAIIDLETVQDLALDGTKRNTKGTITSLGFSLLRNRGFLEVLAMYSGASFNSNPQGLPEWNSAGLAAALGLAQDWLKAGAGSVDAEILFNNGYGLSPDEKVLESKRQVFVYRTASTFLTGPGRYKRNLQINWIGNEDRKVLVLPGLVAAAIPESSRHVDRSLAFLSWLMEADVQTRHIDKVVSNGLDSFGFLGAFPTNREVYEKVLPQYYPHLTQKILPEDDLVFPESEAIEWQVWVQDVFLPYMESALAESIPQSALERKTREWLLQKGIQP